MSITRYITRRKYIALSSAAVMTAAMVTSPTGKVWAQDTEELSIGVLSALTGGGISWGMAVLGGVELAAEEVNEAGGLKVGDKTYKLKIIAYDDKYAGPSAAQAAQRLVSQDGVKIIFGPFGSVPVLATADIVEGEGILSFINSYTTKALNADKKYTFRLTPTTAEISSYMVDAIKRQVPDAKSVVILSPNDDSGKEVGSHSMPEYSRAGVGVQSHEFYERGLQDFVPILTRVLANNPDIIDVNGSTPVDSGVIMKQARQLGFKGQFVKVGGPGVAEIIDIAGEASEGLFFYSPWDPAAPEIKKLTDRFEAKYKMPMNGLGIFFYEGAHMVFDTIQTMGTLDNDTLAAEFASAKPYDGVQGRYIWGGQATYGVNHQWIAPFYLGQVKGGKEVMVEKIEP